MTESRSVARFRAALAELDPRISLAARLRAIFPQIEGLAAVGVPMAAILDDLKEAGLDVRPDTLKKTLYRWRKSRRPADGTAAFKGARIPSDPAPTPAPVPDGGLGHPKAIRTPGDLRKIRDMPVDLDALRREGQNTRRAATSTHNSNQQDKERTS